MEIREEDKYLVMDRLCIENLVVSYEKALVEKKEVFEYRHIFLDTDYAKELIEYGEARERMKNMTKKQLMEMGITDED